jgi:hypothetical protein
MLDLPETLEEIVIWKLENAHIESYLHHLQSVVADRTSGMPSPGFTNMITRRLVLEWFVRIHALGMVTSVQTYNDELAHQYYTVSVAGIEICILGQKERNEILGVTDA